jgi:hypothetical protein
LKKHWTALLTSLPVHLTLASGEEERELDFVARANESTPSREQALTPGHLARMNSSDMHSC